MFCSKCGNEIKEGARFCPKCGAPTDVTQTFVKNEGNKDLSIDKKKIRCPQCGATDLEYIVENESTTQVTGGGYSGSKGCLGFLLLGPFGLLCGNCGNSQQTTVTNNVKHFWLCKSCGYKFQAMEDLKGEIEKKKQIMKQTPTILVICMVGIICELIFEACLHSSVLSWAIWLFIICAVLVFCLRPVLQKQIEQLESEYEELEKKMY